jgi:uncharacterized protein YjdB
MAAALLAFACKEEDPAGAHTAQSVTLNTAGMIIEIGQVEPLQATVLPDNLTDKTIVWRSSNNKIVTVTDAGEVAGVSTGQTMVTAYTLNGKRAACTITVTDVIPTGITLNATTAALLVGEKRTVRATVLPYDAIQRVTWNSSNTDAVIVGDAGEITAAATGSATVTATTHNGFSAACAVTVSSIPATGVTLQSTLSIAAGGGKEQLTATVLPFPGAAQAVTWSSSDPGVVSVDAATGEVTAIAATGSAVITATVVENTNFKATCTVTVIPAITLTLNGYSGAAATLTYTDNSTDALTLVDNRATVVRNTAKTVESVTLNNGAVVLIGRKADSDIALNFNGTLLAFRDAAGGFIPIGSYAEFQLISSAVSGSYRQEADIDLMSERWTPVGASSSHFSGTFDGAGYALANLLVNNTANEGNGLFGWATSATFKNIRVVSGSVTSTQSCTGGICGWSTKCTFFACRNNATINGGNNSTGGIGGYGNSRFIACINTGNITTTGQYAGGIVAYGFDNGIPAGVVASYNTGTLTGTGANPHSMGGIAGQMSGSLGVVACYNTGMVTSTATSVGGIAGVGYAAVQYNYWNTNNANATGNNTGTGNLKFSGTNWPTAAIHAQWGTGDGSADGKYWKSLGSWNGGSPVYPKLFFEE